MSSQQAELLEKYIRLLLQWNKRINLISRKDEPNIWTRHVLHCASLLFSASIQQKAKVMDLGTGGGLPGIPIRILMPTLSVTLVDSMKKKTGAVVDLVDQLGLADVRVECARAEELATKKGFKNEFDYVFARSVADLKRLVKWSFPFLKSQRSDATTEAHVQGKTFIESPALVAMKGGDLMGELATARRNKHVKDIEVIHLNIKGLDASHNPDRKAVIVHFR
ncbi:MAG: 16S rRNA (guanine(527)-N(7))-methyltransferase RsmG [Bacteroidota bacterium]